MSRTKTASPFSQFWLFVSMAIFIVIELIIGGLVGEYLIGRYLSISLSFTLQGLLNLSAYLIGGFIIGLISPKVRIAEPALGAFLSVGVMLMMSFFTPFVFIQFSIIRWLIGGLIAAFLAFLGAELGERLTGYKPDASKAY